MTSGSLRAQPRLLASTGALLMSPLGWIFELIAESGYAGAELVVNHTADTRQPERVAELSARAGIDIPVVHGPYMLMTRAVLGANYIAKTRRSLELASAVGATYMVAHPPYQWERRAQEWLGQDLATEAEEYSATFAMENLYPFAGRNFCSVVTPEDLQPYDHVVFDTSHFAVAGIDLFEAWEALRGRVAHLHVSDNLGNGRDSHAPLGTGVLPLDRFLAHVGASGYTGDVTLEVDIRAHMQTRSTLVAFLTSQRTQAQRLLAGDMDAARTLS